MSGYHRLSEEEFDACCDAYRAMMRKHQHKTYDQRRDALNRFRAGQIFKPGKGGQQ